ncbi:MAG: hypothetical protein IKO41_13435 [Lachnospiraceae bacterium]|nr:hypothetical protein [Lachnospiraceae bacterium]
MIYIAKNNIYLCDLAFLGATVGQMDEGKKRQIVGVSFPDKSYRLLVEKCPQGWHVVRAVDSSLAELSAHLEELFEPREVFPYLAFLKIRESKMRAVRVGKVILLILTLLWARKFLLLGLMRYAVMSVLAFLMFVTCFFLPREILKKTYEDFIRESENDGGPSPMDFHDMFN